MDRVEEMELRLWEYIDGAGTTEERSLIERLIREQAEWRAKYSELMEVHSLIGSTELEQPSLRFTRNVMEEIARTQIAPATRNYINKKVIWGIAAFFITVIASFVIYGISQVDWSAASTDSNMAGVDFSKVDYSAMFNNNLINGFMMLNIILGLMLFDRYLTNKKGKLLQSNTP